MPSSQENNETITTFTLSFGGIEFCLSPSSSSGSRPSNDDDDDSVDDAAGRAGVMMSVAKIRNGEVSIDLNGFVGTLRVRDRNAAVLADVVVEATAAPPPPLATTESPIIGRNDDNGDDDVRRSRRSGAGGLPSSSRDDGTSGAAGAAAAPNPVEDTPSPNEKGRAVGGGEEAEEEEEEEEEKPTNAGGGGGRRKKGQQQKLDFFGRNGNKRGLVVASKSTEKSSNPPPKRRTDAAGVVDQEAEAPDGRRKKSRTSNDEAAAEEEEDAPPPPDDNIAEFEDFIEEESGNDYSGDCNALATLASLGQTMPSQDNESSMDGDGVFLDRKNKTRADNDDADSSSRPASSSAGAAPYPRWGHTMTMIDHRRFVVYGGQTIDKGTGEGPSPLADLHVHDLEDGSWTRPINCDGIARTWHTANFLPERRLLLCFGGEVLDGSTGRLTTTDQVMVLDTEIMLWYPPTVTGQIPSGRSGHASCFLPDTNELVVFGGVKNGRWLNSVAVLDTNRWRWSTPKAIGDAPRPRSYHSATVIGGDRSSSDAGSSSRVVIFGGNDGSRCFDSVHVLDAASSGGEGKRWVWSNPKCGGVAPSPRTGHVATLLNDGSTIMVYGGWDPNTEVESGDDLIFGDSYLLDTRTWTWKVGPRPRYEKSTAADPKNGGAERVGHSAVLAPGGKNGVQVLAFGGRVQGGEFVGDFQSLIA